MSVTYGFYNSLNHDRLYDATQMSSLFDGIINDGVFQNIGTAMIVTENSGMTVNVGIGRAWFNHTWTLNDSILPLEVPGSQALLNRIDAVVLEVDHSDSVRANDIKIVTGAPSSTPVRPTLIDDEYVHQHALAYIYVSAGATEITGSNITNMVGTDETPFVTGPLTVLSAEELYRQWQSQFDETLAVDEAEFTQWFNEMKGQLSEDAAGHLQLEIDEIKAQMGGSILETKEEIMANTEAGHATGALATKGIYESLNAFQFRTQDGKPQWKLESQGADSWAFFSSGKPIISQFETAKSTSISKDIDVSAFGNAYVYCCYGTYTDTSATLSVTDRLFSGTLQASSGKQITYILSNPDSYKQPVDLSSYDTIKVTLKNNNSSYSAYCALIISSEPFDNLL